MAKQAESRLVAAIRTALEADGWLSWKNHGGPYSLAGLPDVMAVRSGQLLAVEVKVPGNKPTAVQLRLLERLAAKGAIVVVAYSVPEVLSAIEEHRVAAARGAGLSAAPSPAAPGSGEESP
jgi:hypothetical protein